MPIETDDEATLPAQGNDTEVPAVETVVEPEAVDAAADTTESGETDTPKDDAKAEVERVRRAMQRRIDRLTHREREALQRAAAAEATAEARAKASELEEDATLSEAEVLTRAEKLAEKLAAEREIIKTTAAATAKVMREATAKYPDFEESVTELVRDLGPQIDAKGRPTPLMQAVLDSDHAAELLRHLGKNTDIAEELSFLTPVQIGRRIARLEDQLAAANKPKSSAAPKPLSPVKPSAVVTVNEAKLSDEQWFQMRRKQRLSA
mgnify:CR=1 FL=1